MRKRLTNSEIKARLVLMVGITLSMVFGISMVAILYSLVFVVQPAEPSPNDTEMLQIVSGSFAVLLGGLLGLLSANGLRDKQDKDKDNDLGQESAYTCKLSELPPGTSKGLLHFVQYKGSTQSHKI